MENFLSFTVSPLFTVLWCLGIFGFAIFHALKLRQSYFELQSEVMTFSYALHRLTPKVFYEEFAKLSIYFRHRHLRRIWKRFESCVDSDVQSDMDLLKICSKKTIFSLLPQYFSSIPTQLSSFGILGTFLGLSVGVYLGRNSLLSDDMSVMQEGLAQILAGISVKFVSSMAGLVCSLAFTNFENSKKTSLENSITKLHDIVVDKIQIKKSNRKNIENSSEIATQIGQHLKTIQNINQQSVNLWHEYTQRFSGHDYNFQALTQAIQDLARVQSVSPSPKNSTARLKVPS